MHLSRSRCRDGLNLMRGAAPHAGHFLLRGQEKVTKEKAALCITLQANPPSAAMLGDAEGNSARASVELLRFRG